MMKFVSNLPQVGDFLRVQSCTTTIEANKAVASSDLEKKEKNNTERERKGGGLVNRHYISCGKVAFVHTLKEYIK